MAKGFAIVPINYEYNDECYYKAGFGEPEKVFTDRNFAQVAVDKMNQDERKKWDDDDFSGYDDELIEERIFFKLVEVEID